MQNVTHWFLVGYILGCRWWYMRVVRVVSLVGCKDYLSSHELSSLTYITPNESWNALCSLYAGGLLWARNYAQKGSVNSVGSVRERTPQELSSALSLTVGAFYFSQIYTEEQNTQHSKQVVAPPPSPPQKGGAWSPRYPYNVGVHFGLSSYWQPNRGNLTYYSPPFGGGDGGGASWGWGWGRPCILCPNTPPRQKTIPNPFLSLYFSLSL